MSSDALPAAGRFRKRSVLVDAWPVLVDAWRVEDLLQVAATGTAALPVWVRQAYDRGLLWFAEDVVVVETLEGRMRGGHGDMLIRGGRGELCPCRGDIFARKYEPV